MIFTFGNFTLDVERRELRQNKVLVAVEPQVFDVLLHLVRNRDRVVTRDDLLSAVWGGRIVSESTLASRIGAVRDAVGDTGREKCWVRTIARRGFRFVGEVAEQVGSEASPPAAHETRGHANENAQNGAAQARNFRRQMTILVCLTIDPSILSADTDPEDLHKVSDAHYAQLRAIAERHGATIARNAPDAAVLHFGHPHAHENDAESAVRAALAIIDIGPGQFSRPRIGVATGVVVVNDSAEHGVADDAIPVGQASLIAAGLAKHAEAATILIAGSTRKLVGGLFECEPVELGDAAAPIAAVQPSRIICESRDQNRFKALRSATTPLFGRKEELQLLSRRWRRAKSGEGQVVLIWGEPGIGKSRLITEIQAAACTTGDASGRLSCAPHRQQTALYPAIDHVVQAAGIKHDDTEQAKHAKLKDLLGSIDNDTREFALFAELLSISTTRDANLKSESPQRRKELVFERFAARFVADGKPKLLVLEDAHWIDPTTMELIDHIIGRVPGLPVLLIITYRPTFSPPWLGQSHVTSITLKRLEKRDNELMVRQVAHGQELPDALVARIVSHSDGIPLFIEEMTKSILEEMTLSGGVKALHPLVMEVPDTLQSFLLERLDRLSSTRAVAQAGAALGRDFTYFMVKAVTQLDDAALKPMLDQLVASELVRQRGAVPHALYTFKHALVQDAAYGTLLKGQRPEIHRRIVNAMEQRSPDAPERDPDLLAYHSTEGRLWEKAIEYRLKATRMALDRSAGLEAEAEVRAALSALANVTDGGVRRTLEGRLHVALGEVYILSKGFASPDVASALTRARTLLGRNSPESLRALCGLFNYHLMRSEAPLGLQLCEPLLRTQLGHATGAVAHFLAGAAHLPMGNFDEALRQLGTSLSLWDEKDCKSLAFVTGHHLRSFMLVWSGLAMVCSGRVASARETMLAAVQDARDRRHAFTLVSTLLAFARFYLHVRNVEAAIMATEEGLAIALEQRSPYHISRANVLRAVNLIESNHPRKGIELMKRALIEHRATGANFQSSFNLSHLALAHARVGEHRQAQHIASEAIEEVKRTGERWWEAEAYRLRGEILLMAHPPNRTQAETCFLNSLACARGQQARLWELRAALSLARLWQSMGKPSEARTVLEPIYRWFARETTIPDFVEAEELLGELSVE